MFEASPVYFQCVNERAAHVKIDRRGSAQNAPLRHLRYKK